MFCRIEDYERFLKPVSAKVDGINREQGAQNLFRDGVRVTDAATLDSILHDSGVAKKHDLQGSNLPPTDEIEAQKASNLLLTEKGKNGGGKSPGRYSRNAKVIGDWAEKLTFQLLEKIEGSSNHTHRAAIGETPGWDIDYIDNSGKLNRVEVKGTEAAAFCNIEITANELNAAKKHGDSYSLYLLARCMSKAPIYQIITNPAKQIDEGEWGIEPTAFRLSF